MSFVLRARELVTSARELTEFGRANGGEVGRMREEHSPSFSEVAVESDGVHSVVSAVKSGAVSPSWMSCELSSGCIVKF